MYNKCVLCRVKNMYSLVILLAQVDKEYSAKLPCHVVWYVS